jgi:transposase
MDWDAVYCSPLSRARDTARLITEHVGRASPLQDESLAEIDVGQMQGKTGPVLRAEHPSFYLRDLNGLGDYSEFGGEAHDAVQARVRSFIALLGEQRGGIEAELASSLQAAGKAARGALLQTAPGVGPAVPMTLLADLPELGTLDRRAIASLAGLAPHVTQSGISSGHAAISGGRPCVRSALYLAALSAIRLERGFKAEYQAMRATGKPAKVAIIAIARKLLVILNQMARDNTAWNRQKG